MINITNKPIEELRASQHCFYFNGFMLCNFIIRKTDGSVITPNPAGGRSYLKFPVKWRPKKEEDYTEKSQN